ncbi:MAG: hypothetical protein GX556_07970, partial [Fibrobacter sp.]|nr:hypothetical protein [Fibrobacter sp.]
MRLTVSGLFRPDKLILVSFLGIVLFGFQTATIAADYRWDTNTNGGIQTGNGTWGTDNFWTTNGTSLVPWPGAGNSATFAGSDGNWTINVSGTQSVDSITFSNGGYNLNGGTIKFENINGIAAASGKTTSINSIINGTGGLKIYATSTGEATLNLNGVNTYPGATTIKSHVRLNVPIIADGGKNSGIGKSSSSDSNLVLDGGTLRHTGAAASTDRLFTLTEKGGNIYASGTGPLKFTNPGTIAFSGSGDRFLEIGGAAEDTSRFSPVIEDGPGGPTLLKKSGPGTFILTGTNTYTGGTTILSGSTPGQGALQIGDGGTSGSITGDVLDSTTLIFNRSDAYTFAGVISGPGVVIQSGTGITSLSGNNTYSGGTTISTGTLQIGNGGTTGSIIGNVTNNSTLAFNRTNAYTFAGVISGPGAVKQSGSDTLTLSGVNTFTGGFTADSGITKVGNAQALGASSNTITINTGAALDVNGYNLQGYTNDIVINGQRNDSTGAIINTHSDQQQNAIRKISLGSDASIGNNGSRFDIGRNIVGSTCITGNSHTLSKVGTNFISILG